MTDNNGEFRWTEDVRTGYISSLTFTNKLVSYAAIDGEAMFEADISLGPVEEMEEAKRLIEKPPPPLPGVAFGVVISGSRFRWPDGVVFFTIDNNLPNQQRVRDAIRHWEDNTNIRFQQRTNEANFVSFQRGNGCSANVGMRGGQQFIRLAGGCGTGTTIHEIGHCVGLWHEQSREDRDSFVTIVWQNIPLKVRHNFEQHISDGDDVGAYNYDSIMHYPANAFAIDPAQPTIVAPQPIGQRTGLNPGDIRTVNAIYPRKTTLADTSPQGPALAGRNGQLLLGWTGTSNLRLNFMRSSDGMSFSHKVTLNDTSTAAPVLAVFRNRYVVAWIGVEDKRLNIMQSSDGRNWTSKVTLNDTSESSPALAIFGNHLYIAWRGVGNNRLNVMRSVDGQNWRDKMVLGDITNSGPALTVVDHRLLLAWRGVGSNRLNVMQSFNGVSFSGKVTLGDTTLSKPSLHVHEGRAYLCWQGVGNRFLNFLESSDGTNWLGKITSGETCIDRPVLGTVGGRLVWSWTGTDPSHHLNTGLI